MTLTALGYIGVHSAKLEDWSSLATGLIGMQQVDAGGATRVFRMDDRKQRFVVTGEDGDRLAFTGWETQDATSMAALAVRLEAAGTRIRRASRAEADARGVADFISFDDPGGNRLELFHGAALADTPFVPGRPISGFRTGPL
ncbi:MAG: biphenyl 2,3-dioxygenase, partial [Xanthobacteraceae bacterium]